MKQYAIGLITGALLAVSAMMFMGSQKKNLGDIIVSSVQVQNENGVVVGIFGSNFDNNGQLMLVDNKSKAFLKPAVVLSIVDKGGVIKTTNADGELTTYLGADINGDGFFTISNADGELAVAMGYDEGSGYIGIIDADGNEGWSVGGTK